MNNRENCFEIIKKNPGILKSELNKMNIGHRSSINLWVSRLVYSGQVVRIFDDVIKSWRLYPAGKEPATHVQQKYFNDLHPCRALYFADEKDYDFGKGHGDKFYTAFDKAFGLSSINLTGVDSKLFSKQIPPTLPDHSSLYFSTKIARDFATLAPPNHDSKESDSREQPDRPDLNMLCSPGRVKSSA